MPGIVGIVTKTPRERNEKDLSLMIDCMMHEPFYTSGTYANDQLGLYAGWVCHKGSFSDCMPVFNEKRELLLIFSGENFADREVTNQLKRHSHEFDSSNASYLIHLYEEEGEKFLQCLNGWFSGILIDMRKEKGVLFNDRYGMQRIYYHESEDAFFFSSEAKSLLKILPELGEIDPQGLGEFFSCGCVLQNRSLFSGIFLLPGGSAWTFRNGNSVRKDYYFRPGDWENQQVLGKETFYKKLKETFSCILPHYFYSREPIAMSLTGGLDTRMIMANIDHRAGELPCYTFGGLYRDSLDVQISRKVANACQQPHHILRIDEKFFSDFPRLSEKAIYIADGSIDLSGSPELYMNRLARDIAKIRITGNYGSEVLRSVRAFKPMHPCEGLFNSDFEVYLKNAEKTFTEVSKGHRLSFTLFKQAPWYGCGRCAIEQSQLTLRTPYMDNDLVSLIYQAPKEGTTNNQMSLRLIKDGNPILSRIMTDQGVEGTHPLYSKCTRLYAGFTFKAEYCYDYGMPQWLARIDHALSFLHLEKLFLGRHKFYHFRIWFREELSKYVQDVLLDKQTLNRPYLNKGFVDKMVSGHIKSGLNYTNEINKMLTAELIQRLLIEQR